MPRALEPCAGGKECPCASGVLEFRTYLGYVPTLDTVQTHIFQFYTPISPHDNTQTIPSRRDTPQVCPPGSSIRLSQTFLNATFLGIKKEDISFDISSSKGAVTYSPDFSVPSARRGLTSLFGMGRGGTLVLWPPYFISFNHSATLCRRCTIKIIDWKQTPFTLRAQA